MTVPLRNGQGSESAPARWPPSPIAGIQLAKHSFWVIDRVIDRDDRGPTLKQATAVYSQWALVA